ncbi:MAG TPA: hypothetical protein VFZ68_01680 [Acidimicrobiales bacterium]
MRTKMRLALAALAVGALTVATAAPAAAQEEPAALGFAVDKTQAQPGALVLGKADAADVAEHCVTDLEAFQTRFQELLAGPFAGLGSEGELFERFFPDFEEGEEVVFDTHDKVAYGLVALVALGLGANLNGAAEDALPQTFVMTFADIATQAPVGERGSFDPDTGEGSVVVPDIDPGLWAVAAACVGPSFDLDVLEAGIRAGGDFLESIDAPTANPLTDPEFIEFMQDFLDSDAEGLDLIGEFLGVIGPNLLEPIMVPDAFGAVIFCILDPQGNCPDGEVEPPPGEPIGPGDDEAGPAQPVVAAPSFTG